MSSSLSNRPRILRGAFLEYARSLTPLIVPFQFNPEQLSRSRSNSFKAPNRGDKSQPRESLRKFHERYVDLQQLRNAQQADVGEESISFDIRLDASDRLNAGDRLAQNFGIAPRLAALELMMLPKSESVAARLARLLRRSGFSYTRGESPPMVLFIWGRKRTLPVNITSIEINETQYTPDLNPVRAIVTVGLSVIEGRNVPYTYSRAMLESLRILDLANIAESANIVIPG